MSESAEKHDGCVVGNDLLDLLDFLIDDHVGIIKYVQERPQPAGSPDFFHYYAEASNTLAFTQQENFRYTGGASTIRRLALAKAVGEAIERYCAAIFDVEQFPLTSVENSSFCCVQPEQFALYSQEQYEQADFPWRPFRRDTAVRWIEARNLTTGGPTFVPAAMVFVPYYYYANTPDTPIVQPMSTGLACGIGFEQAAVSAICEVVERDAFTITWQAKLSPPSIDLATLSGLNRDLVARFERAASQIHIFDITLENGLTSVLSIAESCSPNSPALVFAAASSLYPEIAVRKSLEELAHTRSYCKQIKANVAPISPGTSFDNIVDQMGHLNFYCNHDNKHFADFILRPSRKVSFQSLVGLGTGDVRSDLEVLSEKISDRGHEVLICDVTSPDVGELGVRVVRAIVPGYHPLFVGHRIRALGGERLWTIPQLLGYPGINLSSGDNTSPHGFP